MSERENKYPGDLPPLFNFVLNPYPDLRVSSCPFCDAKTAQRKRPLVIHIEPRQLTSVNYTCRYCKECDLLIAHKHEIEHYLTEMMLAHASEMIGNEYLILGTVERKLWKKSMAAPMDSVDMLDHLHRFKTCYQELRITEQGWFGPGQEPGVRKPPPSREWVRQ